MLTIKEWAEDDKPREKLLSKGIASLSDAELLAILISTGTKNETALGLAKRVLSLTDNNLNELGKLSVTDFQKIKGIGEAKAITIVAALELGRRRKLDDAIKRKNIRTSTDIVELFQGKLADLPHEEFWLLMLSNAMNVIGEHRISQGGVSSTAVDVRLIMKPAVEKLASAIAVVHNHPSGNRMPSELDRLITKKIAEAASIFNIRFIDHIIIADTNTFSFAEEGLL